MNKSNRKVIFLGAGDRSKEKCEKLHKDLDKALSILSGIQQEGLQGTRYDHDRIYKWKGKIKKIYNRIGEKLGAVK